MKECAYFLNLDNIFNYIFDNGTVEKNDSEITELYVMDESTKKMTLSTKEMHEVKSNGLTTNQTIRFELVKMLLERLLDMENSDMTLGDTIVVNTLLLEDLITEKQ